MEGKSVFLRSVETQPLGRREGGKGTAWANAKGHQQMTAGGESTARLEEYTGETRGATGGGKPESRW